MHRTLANVCTRYRILGARRREVGLSSDLFATAGCKALPSCSADQDIWWYLEMLIYSKICFDQSGTYDPGGGGGEGTVRFVFSARFFWPDLKKKKVFLFRRDFSGKHGKFADVCKSCDYIVLHSIVIIHTRSTETWLQTTFLQASRVRRGASQRDYRLLQVLQIRGKSRDTICFLNVFSARRAAGSISHVFYKT